MMQPPDTITLQHIRESMYSAVICDALDGLGFTQQSPNIDLSWLTVDGPIVGRCRTTLWADMHHSDPAPYELELQAVDSCEPDDVLIAAGGDSMRSALWGELLTTAVLNGGCVGAIIDGAIRDTAKIRDLNFPVLARGKRIYDSRDRHRVIDLNIPVDIGSVTFHPGDLVVADEDGIVVVPQHIEHPALQSAWQKIHAENQVRDAIKNGLKATDAWNQFGVL